MEYVKIEGQFPKFSHCAVTLGKFDGIHRGHRKLIQTILEQQKRIWRTGSGHGVCFRQTDDPYFRRTSYTSGKNGRGHTVWNVL